MLLSLAPVSVHATHIVHTLFGMLDVLFRIAIPSADGIVLSAVPARHEQISQCVVDQVVQLVLVGLLIEEHAVDLFVLSRVKGVLVGSRARARDA